MNRAADIRKWLQHLGVRCAMNPSAEDAEVKVRSYVADLSDMPEGVFCEASLTAASRHFEFFPALAALRRFLDEWWEDNRPRRPQLPGPGSHDLEDPEDRAWAQSWLRHSTGDWGTDKDGATRTGTVADLRKQLERIRKIRPRVFRWLVLNNTYAAEIAARAGWEDPTPSQGVRERSPEEIAAVEAAIQRMFEGRVYNAHSDAIANAAAAQTAARLKAAAERSQQQVSTRPAKTMTAVALIAAREKAGIDLPPPPDEPPTIEGVVEPIEDEPEWLWEKEDAA